MIRKETEWHITAKELPAASAIANLSVLIDGVLELELGYYDKNKNVFCSWGRGKIETWPVEQVKCWAAEIAMPTLEELAE